MAQNPDPAVAQYANHLAVAYTMLEFVLDFGQIYPGEEPKLVARVVVAPGHFTHFARIVSQSVERYEAEHGRVPE